MMQSILSCLCSFIIVVNAARHSDFHHFGPVQYRNGQNSDTVDYLFSRRQATWDAAVKGCNGYRGSRLLSVEDNEESQVVLGMINNDGLFDPPLPMGTSFWTSGAYNFKLLAWEWTSSTSKNVTFGSWSQKLWAKGQPTKPIHEIDRVALERNNLNHSSWKSIPSKEKAFYVCEL